MWLTSLFIGLSLIFPTKHPEYLINQMGNNSFKVRERAELELRLSVYRSLPWLRQHQNHPQLEIARRVQRVLNDYYDVFPKEDGQMPTIRALPFQPLANWYFYRVEKANPHVFFDDWDTADWRPRHATWLLCHDMLNFGIPKIDVQRFIAQMQEWELRMIPNYHGP